MACTNTAESRLENSAQVLSCKLKFVQGQRRRQTKKFYKIAAKKKKKWWPVDKFVISFAFLQIPAIKGFLNKRLHKKQKELAATLNPPNPTPHPGRAPLPPAAPKVIGRWAGFVPRVLLAATPVSPLN